MIATAVVEDMSRGLELGDANVDPGRRGEAMWLLTLTRASERAL